MCAVDNYYQGIKIYVKKISITNMKKLTCQCGGVEIEVKLPDDLGKLMRCNCSICKRKSATMSMIGKDDLKIVKGEGLLKTYQYHTKVAKHYFCSICGIYTHHNPRSNPAMTGFNLGCIDEIDTFDLKNIAINDGYNHPLDKE